jgi:hypothetical protein
MSTKKEKKVEIPNKLLEEVLGFYETRNFLIVIFSALLVVPFVFLIINFLNLRTCQSNPSRGCPSLDPPPPETT